MTLKPSQEMQAAINRRNAQLLRSEANKRQVGGDHYKKAGATGEEHWDRVVRLEMDYLRACATKYIERCWDKYGIEDLEKSIHYIQKAIEVAKAQDRKGKMEKQYAETAPITRSLPRQEWEPRSTNQFTYEGGDVNVDFYTCNVCRMYFDVKVHTHPGLIHQCPPRPELPDPEHAATLAAVAETVTGTDVKFDAALSALEEALDEPQAHGYVMQDSQVHDNGSMRWVNRGIGAGAELPAAPPLVERGYVMQDPSPAVNGDNFPYGVAPASEQKRAIYDERKLG